MAYCTNCGMKMDEGDVFCSNCGTMVEEQVVSQMDKYDSFLALKQELDSNRMVPPRNRKKRNWIKWVGLSMLLVATVSIALVIVLNTTVYKQKSVEGTVDLFFEAIEDNDIDKYMMFMAVA